MQTAFLRAYLLTVDTGSMAEAARRLHLTPAAVAQQIRSLEQEIGVALVRRAGRSVRPTEAGYRILEKARRLLRDAGELASLAGQDELCAELRLGSIYTALDALVPEAIERLAAAQPRLRFHIRSAVSSELFDAVQRGELDAAVCLHPQFALPKTIAWQLLREERLVALVPRALAGGEAHALLAREPFIRYDRKEWGGQQVERYLRAAGIVPHERMELGHLRRRARVGAGDGARHRAARRSAAGPPAAAEDDPAAPARPALAPAFAARRRDPPARHPVARRRRGPPGVSLGIARAAAAPCVDKRA